MKLVVVVAGFLGLLSLVGCVDDAPSVTITAELNDHARAGGMVPYASTEDVADLKRIAVESTGCFHNTLSSVRISGGWATVNDRNGAHAPLKLTNADLHGLGLWLAYLRKGGENDCTTTDKIVFDWGDRDERFVDATCRRGSDDAVTVNDLIARARAR